MNHQLPGLRAGYQATAEDIRAIFLRHHQALYYFAFDQLQNNSRAEDAVAFAFLECWKNVSQHSREIESQEQIEQDLYAYTLNFCHRHLGQLYRDRVLSGIFNRELTRHELDLRVIESKVIQQLS